MSTLPSEPSQHAFQNVACAPSAQMPYASWYQSQLCQLRPVFEFRYFLIFLAPYILRSAVVEINTIHLVYQPEQLFPST